ncbi:MAG: hypothetical protein LUC97_08305 [Clostridiales bacterium]|nr:hypothetical protein [Clostridiales bacterium]
MKNTVDTYIRKFLGEHSKKQRFLYAMLLLALLVSLAVYWRLKYTGIALTNEVYCGLVEHTHTEECYETVLVCGLEEGEEVFLEDDTLSGEAVSTETHVHTDDCYEKVLICGLEEHVHTVDCLTDHSLDETDEARAGGGSSGGEADEETSEEEASSDEETEISSDEPQAVSDNNSESSESSSGGSSGGSSEEDYDLPTLTGYTLTDFAAAAESQIGYAESLTDCVISDEDGSLKGFTKYGQWYGNTYGNWDAMFVSYCLDYAGITDEMFPKNSGAYAWAAELGSLGYYHEKDGYEPKRGDLVFLDTADNGKPDRVGVVLSVNDDSAELTAAEGDFSDGSGTDRVCENEYSLNSDIITGYGVIPDEDASSAVVYTAEDSGVSVRVTAPSDALPEGSELSVLLYEKDRSEFTEAAEAIGYDGEYAEMAVVDIAFSLDGEKTEPVEAVEVSLDVSQLLPDDANLNTVEIQHLAETSDGIEPVLVADASSKTDGTLDTETAVAEFTVDSFSSFTITWRSYEEDSSDSISITATSYLYQNGSTTTTEISGRAATLLTTLDGDQQYNVIDLTSSNGDLVIANYTLTTATVNLVQSDGTTVSVEGALSISITGSSSEGYIYTVETSSGSVSYTDIASASVYLYYSYSATDTETELDPTSYNSSAKVYWDIFETDEDGDHSGTNSTTGISYVQMGSESIYAVPHENSTATSWSTTASALSAYFPNAYAGSTAATSVTESGKLIIVPETGYYITRVVIACGSTRAAGAPSGGGGSSTSGGRNPYTCQTWEEENAYDTVFTVAASGAMTIDVSSLYFSHNGNDDDIYFILIQVDKIASSIYVQYDYGEIVDILGVTSGYGGAFDYSDGWTATSGGNSYGSLDESVSAWDGDPGVKTDDTQYKYSYADVSEVEDWAHYANTVISAAKLEAAAAGYYFAGWKAEYYYDVDTGVFTSGTDTSEYLYEENYIYTFDDDDLYTTSYYDEGETAGLYTHVKIIALWEPIALTVTKTVKGLSDTDFASESHTFTLILQKQNDDGTWENYKTAYVTISGDGSGTLSFSPVIPGTYRVVENTDNVSVLQNSSSTVYLTVNTDGSFEVSTDDILTGEDLALTYTVANSYSDARTEPLPSTGGIPLPYAAAFIMIAGSFAVLLYNLKRQRGV